MRFSKAVFLAAVLAAPAVQAQQSNMTFFVTSVGKGNGADLGGLEGADAYCSSLAKTAGAVFTGSSSMLGNRSSSFHTSWPGLRW